MKEPLKNLLAHALAILCLLQLPASGAQADADKRPNVLFVLTDDMGWADPSCYGNKEVATPNLDRLAQEGRRFTQFYVASPVCSPSRTAFLTGCYPARWGMNYILLRPSENAAHDCVNWLDPKAPTLARTLQAAGYATAHFGKWHLGGGPGMDDAPWPKEYGFDESHVNCQGCGPRIDGFGSGGPLKVEGRMLARHEFTGFWADKAMDFMRRHKAGPFFVELWPQDVHAPFMPDPEELPHVAETPPERHKFNAVLKRYDREIGRVLDFLKREGLEENTLVVFASDNGPSPSYKRHRTGGLRGEKYSLYEGGIRSPLLVRWPGHVPAGSTDSTSVLGAVDFFPTVCALSGIALPKDATPDGVDAGAALLGAPFVRSKPLLWEYGRKPNYLLAPKEGRSPTLGVREGNWKLLINADGSKGELYDVEADPNETTNLAETQAEVAKRLSEQVLAWRRSLP